MGLIGEQSVVRAIAKTLFSPLSAANGRC